MNIKKSCKLKTTGIHFNMCVNNKIVNISNFETLQIYVGFCFGCSGSSYEDDVDMDLAESHSNVSNGNAHSSAAVFSNGSSTVSASSNGSSQDELMGWCFYLISMLL